GAVRAGGQSPWPARCNTGALLLPDCRARGTGIGPWAAVQCPMAEVLFDHLETRPLEAVVPQLLEKTLERGWRAVIECGSRERAEALDAHLWSYRDDSFLPHGVDGEEVDHLQPILLTTSPDNPNGASVRFFVDRAVPQSTEGYQ